MNTNLPRRGFLQASVAGAMIPAASTIAAEPKAINVVVWDERQPEQKQAYDNFLGNQIADHLKSKPGLAVKSVGIEDDEKGLSPGIMRPCDVLIWWGHKRQAEITAKMVQPRLDAAQDLKRDRAKVEIEYVAPAKRYTLPKTGDRLTPYTELRKFTDGSEKAALTASSP